MDHNFSAPALYLDLSPAPWSHAGHHEASHHWRAAPLAGSAAMCDVQSQPPTLPPTPGLKDKQTFGPSITTVARNVCAYPPLREPGAQRLRPLGACTVSSPIDSRRHCCGLSSKGVYLDRYVYTFVSLTIEVWTSVPDRCSTLSSTIRIRVHHTHRIHHRSITRPLVELDCFTAQAPAL